MYTGSIFEDKEAYRRPFFILIFRRETLSLELEERCAVSIWLHMNLAAYALQAGGIVREQHRPQRMEYARI